ncbi:MAG TPA: DUF4190 domain-containing protein [Luteolibacter sp.]
MSVPPVPPPVQSEFPSSAPNPTPSRNSGYAVASLVTALLCLSLVPVVLGHIALGKIKRSAGALKGQGLAIAGLVMGYLQLILLPLLIIPILFIGARAWKKGSDRAGCIMNQRNVQQAVRMYQSANGLKPGDPIDWQEIVGPGKVIESAPACPAQGKYRYQARIPAGGALVVECSKADTEEQHVPKDHQEW